MATTSPTKTIEKPQVPKPPVVSQTPTLGPITPDEQALASRIATGSAEWETIKEEDVVDFSLSEDPFKLPDLALRLQAEKKFKFRWYTRTPERVDQVKNFSKVRRWWVVNRTQPVAGLFDNVVDTCTGGIHCLDQLLFFKPWWLWVAEEKLDQKLADSQVDLTDRNEEEKNNLRFAASKRKLGEKSKGRQEVHGGDVLFKGEEDVDSELGQRTPAASESDLTTEV